MSVVTREFIAAMFAMVKVNYPFAYKEIKEEEELSIYKLWYESFKDYPAEIVEEAFKRAIKTCKIAVTVADIVEQIDKIKEAFEPSPEELWNEFSIILNKTSSDVFCMRTYNIGESGQKAFKVYESMKPEFKRFCGWFTTFCDLCLMSEEQLNFEKARFLKNIKEYKSQVYFQQSVQLNNPKLAALIQNNVKLLGAGEKDTESQ